MTNANRSSPHVHVPVGMLAADEADVLRMRMAQEGSSYMEIHMHAE